ncbi:MAG: Hsp20/alpha crystallin family protein [Planctomycetota bacterium]|nr:Hsp20/alpha crystallin family protein [Planctomycetota bacterium]
MSLSDWDRPKDGGAKSGFALTDLKSEMQRMFDQYLKGPLEAVGESYSSFKQFYPALDLVEGPEEIVVHFELPAVDPQQIDLNVTSGTLTVSGERTAVSPADSPTNSPREIRWGRFTRTVQLPAAVDTHQTAADYKNGLLTVRLKKAAISSSEKVSIAVS